MVERVAVTLLLAFLPFFLIVPVLFVGAFNAHKIRGIYPGLQSSSFLSRPKLEKCPLCGRKIAREKFTRILPLFPYTFKVMRHYEKWHKEIGKYARRSRLAITLSVLLAIHSFAAAGALTNLQTVTPDLQLVEVIAGLLGAYLFIQLIVWTFLAYLLLHKKGSLFE